MSENPKPLQRGPERDELLADYAQQPLQPGDYYMEGSAFVFTEQYHHRRGYCCNFDCRHCPYRGLVEEL